MESNTKPKVLYVDDEENNLLVFKSSFRRFYDIYVAKSATEGIDIILKHDIDVIITDQRMPGMTGVDFLKQLPEDLLAIRMVLTGFSDVAAIIEAINSGKVYRYIMKPWDKDELKVTIDNAVEALILKKNNQKLMTELQSANEHLEQKVTKRTAELETALLEINKQKQELENLNATKNKLFSIVAHDLRNPVAALAGFSSILSEYGDELSPEEISVYSKEVHQSIENALSLVENLLSWASSQMKKFNHNPQRVKVNEIIEEMLPQFAMTASYKQLSLENDLASEMYVYADEDHLRLVLRNLLSNSIKFSERGAKIILTSRQIDDSKVEISVNDSGVGMSDEQLAQLFKVGDKNSSNGTEGEKGTGLGLVLCKEFIELNGGTIHARSTKGSGSTFTIQLGQY